MLCSRIGLGMVLAHYTIVYGVLFYLGLSNLKTKRTLPGMVGYGVVIWFVTAVFLGSSWAVPTWALRFSMVSNSNLRQCW